MTTCQPSRSNVAEHACLPALAALGASQQSADALARTVEWRRARNPMLGRWGSPNGTAETTSGFCCRWRAAMSTWRGWTWPGRPAPRHAAKPDRYIVPCPAAASSCTGQGPCHSTIAGMRWRPATRELRQLGRSYAQVGLAGNIGAGGVHSAAATLELRLHQGTAPRPQMTRWPGQRLLVHCRKWKASSCWRSSRAALADRRLTSTAARR